MVKQQTKYNTQKRSIRRNLKKGGFAAVEALVGLVVILAIAAGIYLYINNQPTTNPRPVANRPLDGTPTVEKDANDYSDVGQPTVYPTEAPLTTDSTDEVINNAATEVNDLMNELNSLDELDSALQEPSVDFSVGF